MNQHAVLIRCEDGYITEIISSGSDIPIYVVDQKDSLLHPDSEPFFKSVRFSFAPAQSIVGAVQSVKTTDI